MIDKQKARTILCVIAAIQVIIAIFANVFYSEAIYDISKGSAETMKSAGILGTIIGSGGNAALREAGVSDDFSDIDGRFSLTTPWTCGTNIKKIAYYMTDGSDSSDETRSIADMINILGKLLTIGCIIMLLSPLWILIESYIVKEKVKSAWKTAAKIGGTVTIIALFFCGIYSAIIDSIVKNSDLSTSVGAGYFFPILFIAAAIAAGYYVIEKVTKKKNITDNFPELDGVIAACTVIVEFLLAVPILLDGLLKSLVNALMSSDNLIHNMIGTSLSGTDFVSLAGIGKCVVFVSMLCIAASYYLKFSNKAKVHILNEKKRCPNCGMNLLTDTKFCGNCGHKFEQTPPPQEHEAPIFQTNQQKQCPRCGTSLPGNIKFCVKCGYAFSQDYAPFELKMRCPTCGTVLPSGTKFCTKCGTKII